MADIERSSAEVQDFQNQLISLGFERLWARNDDWESYLRGDYDFYQDLPDDLRRKDPMWSYEFKADIETVKGKLDRTLETNVQPHSPLVRDETKADQLEEMRGNWRIQLDPNGWISDGIRFAQACKAYAAVWLDWVDWALPSRRPYESNPEYNKRCDDYRKSWFGFKLQLDPCRTTMFADERKQIVAAGRRYEIPILEVARLFGDYKRGEERSSQDEANLMFQVAREQFPWVRGAEPQAMGRGWAYKRVEVFTFDDGVWLTTHVLAAPGRADAPSVYKQVSKSWRNPFGRPTLFVVSGTYNAGEPLDKRYEPLLLPLLQAYRNRDFLRSLLSSMASSKTVHDAISVAPALAETLAQLPADQRLSPVERRPDGMLVLYGTPVSTMTDLQELTEKLLVNVEAEVSRLRFSSVFSGENVQQVVEQSTASAVLQAVQEENVKLKSAVESRTAFEQDIGNAIEHMYTEWGKNPDMRDEKAWVRLTGTEALPHGRKPKPGKVIDLSPADFNFPHSTTVVAVDDSLAARAARGAEADRLWEHQPKGITYLDWLKEQGNPEPTEVAKKISADQQFQLLGPRVQKAAETHFVNYYSQFLGTDPTYLAGLIDGNGPTTSAAGPPGGGGGGGGDNGPPGGGYQVQAPNVPTPTGTSQAVTP